MPLFRFAAATILLTVVAIAQNEPAQDEPAALVRFQSLNNTFLLELPAGYRQLAPNEALQLSENPASPAELRSTSPHSFYAVGLVDRWLAGEIASPWLYVMEQGNEWYIDGDFAELLKQRWAETTAASGETNAVTDVREVEVGPKGHTVHLARRTRTPVAGRPVTSLDVYAPTAGRQVTLSFCAWADDFDRLAPEFDKWLSTLTFSRPPRGQQSLSDRLWTPLLTGGIVGVILLLLYKHTRRSR